VDGELLLRADSIQPLDDRHRALGKEAPDGREDALVAVDSGADPEGVGDVAHHVELAVLAGDLLHALLHRREAPHDERREHDGEEREQHARDPVRGVDQDLENDDRRQQEQRDELEEGDLEEELAGSDRAELEVREDEDRVDEEEHEQRAGGQGGDRDPADAGRVERTAEEGGGSVGEGELRELMKRVGQRQGGTSRGTWRSRRRRRRPDGGAGSWRTRIAGIIAAASRPTKLPA
jgi:hypothetical protein